MRLPLIIQRGQSISSSAFAFLRQSISDPPTVLRERLQDFCNSPPPDLESPSLSLLPPNGHLESSPHGEPCVQVRTNPPVRTYPFLPKTSPATIHSSYFNRHLTDLRGPDSAIKKPQFVPPFKPGPANTFPLPPYYPFF